MLLYGNKYADLMPDNRSYGDGDAWADKFFSAKVRRFKSGAVEVIAAPVPGMARKRISDRVGLAQRPRRSVVSQVEAEQGADSQEAQQLRDQLAAENKARAIRRAKQQVRFQVKAITADHLLTLTYRTKDDAPMGDLGRLKVDWKRFCRLVREGLPASEKFRAHPGLDSWKFVAIREKQDNGAYHLHVAVSGRQDINYLRRCWYVAAGGSQDDSGADTVGAVNVRGPSKRFGKPTYNWRPDKLAGYMTKYLYKTFDDIEEKGSKRYWVGRHNDKFEVIKFWLSAQTYSDAVRETFRIIDFYVDTFDGQKIFSNTSWRVLWWSS